MFLRDEELFLQKGVSEYHRKKIESLSFMRIFWDLIKQRTIIYSLIETFDRHISGIQIIFYRGI